jgi:hypothetical protein
MKKRTIVSICTIALSLTLHAQKIPSVAVFSLNSKNTPETAVKTANDVVFSFINEQRSYRIVDMRRDPLPTDLSVPDGIDYVFFGTIEGQPDGIRLELVLKGGPWAITRKISRVYESTNRILLESRMLVRDLFDQSVALPDPALPDIGDSSVESRSTEVPSQLITVEKVDSLAGSWHGETGIEKVLILRGGRGVAVFSSGVSISLEVLLSGEDLLVRQKGASTPRQFTDLPDAVAQQAANIAPPIEWRFRITPDQKTLSGIKKAVIFKNDGKNILTMENAETRVSWNRD